MSCSSYIILGSASAHQPPTIFLLVVALWILWLSTVAASFVLHLTRWSPSLTMHIVGLFFSPTSSLSQGSLLFVVRNRWKGDGDGKKRGQESMKGGAGKVVGMVSCKKKENNCVCVCQRELSSLTDSVSASAIHPISHEGEFIYSGL